MQTAAVPGTSGFVSSFVEIFVWVMTMPAYQALWELICPSINPYAWGYDFWYDGYARDRVPGHKMGIMSTVRVMHEQDTGQGGAGRTDNTAEKVKWAAVMEQERHYKRQLGVDLKWYRTHLDLANSSWSGAVKGYLTPPLQRVAQKVDAAEYDTRKKPVLLSSSGKIVGSGDNPRSGRRRRKSKKQDIVSSSEMDPQV
jgi:hypothetical protein